MLTRRLQSVFLLIAMAALAAAQADYHQSYRPEIHFSPLRNWTNDPNGLVYFHGEYHLFFQFNPKGDQWGHMSWGHAVSKDLLHWRELSVAIPEKDGEMVFTGSVVVDTKNTSGFCAKEKECLVAVYTGHRPASDQAKQEARQTQNIAYSLDDGRSWTRYSGNPVLDLHLSDFRDPSVSWDEARGRWLMTVSLPMEHKVRFYSSPDLKKWTQLSDFGPAGDVAGAWECPDLLRIPDEKGSGDMWALKVGLNPGAPQGGSGEQYFLGSFDGTKFTPSGLPGSHGWTNYGKDDYCAISFNGLPPGEKPILIGWMDNWQYADKLPTSPWRGQMSLPRRLSLLRDEEGLAISQQPVVEAVRGKHLAIQQNENGEIKVGEIDKAPFELALQFEPAGERSFGLRIYSDKQHWTEIIFDRENREFSVDRIKSSKPIAPDFPSKTVAPIVEGRPYDLKLIVDRSSVEAYAQGGTIAMSNLIFPPSGGVRIVLFSASGKPLSVTGDLWQLRSIWK
jgi:fructan beta-fructosidase